MITMAFAVHRTYAIRAQVAESIAHASPLKEAVATAFRRDGTPPRDRDDAGVLPHERAQAGPYVDALEIVDGRIEIHFGRKADDAIASGVLSLTPFETAQHEIVWLCGTRPPSVGLQPLGFSHGSRRTHQVGTTINARYLPAMCR